MLNGDVLTKVQANYDATVNNGFEVIGTFLQGSQNYKCDVYTSAYHSDVDTKSIILPSFDDFVRGKMPYSSTLHLVEDGQTDVKDVRPMFEMFKKQNISYVELLFTKYYKVNEKYADLWWYVVDLREKIARLSPTLAVKSMMGQSMEKLKALEHPYPTLIEKINKFGYDPKQLHHIVRLNEVIKRYIAGESYVDLLVPENPGYLIGLKLGVLSLEDARKLAQETDADTKKVAQDFCENYSGELFDSATWDRLNDIKVEFLKRRMKEELQK